MGKWRNVEGAKVMVVVLIPYLEPTDKDKNVQCSGKGESRKGQKAILSMV